MIIITINKKTNPIHSGAVTHHQDQSITLVSLSIRNARKRSVEKLMPLLAKLESFIFISFYWFNNTKISNIFEICK